MKKGISPVVAVVLLIAIAVIAAVGVWYWVGSYTGQPNVTTNVKTFTIQDCNGTHVFVQNTGKETLNSNVNVYETNGASTGAAINFSGASLASGSAAWQPLTNSTGGVIMTSLDGNYQALGTNIQTVPFSC